MYLTDDDLKAMKIIQDGLAQEKLPKQVDRYPLTNICTDANDNLYIEIACAGFNKSDLKVELVQDFGIIVTGTWNGDEECDFTYFQKHIREKSFERKIALDEAYLNGDVKVLEYTDGLLAIRVVPKAVEPKAPTRIELTI